MRNNEINKARAFIYNILSLLFVEEHVKNSPSKIVENLKLLSENSFDEMVSNTCKDIVEYVEANGLESIYADYQETFLVPFGDTVPLSASWFHEQREGGIMQLKVKDILGKTKMRRDEKDFTAQEDHYGFIFTLSAYLLEQQLNEEIKEDLQKELFKDILNPYCDELFYRLMGNPSFIYSRIGLILSAFCGFERVYLDIQKPNKQ